MSIVVPQAALDWLASLRAEHCSPLSYHPRYRCTLALLCDGALTAALSPAFPSVERLETDPLDWLQQHYTSPQYRHATVLLRQELLANDALWRSCLKDCPLLACVSSAETPVPELDELLRVPPIRACFDGQHYVAVLPLLADDTQPQVAGVRSEHPLTKSQQQLQFVWQRKPLKDAVWSFLNGWLRFSFPEQTADIHRLLDEGIAAKRPDSDIYSSMHDLLCNANQAKIAARSSQTSSNESEASTASSSSSSGQSTTTSRPSYRTNMRTRDIQQLLDEVNVESARSILDFGCAEGSITAALGQLLRVSAANTHGCDVRDIPNATDFTFSKAIENQPLPYSDGQFSLAFVLMVLHHIPAYEQSVKELLRVIEPGGLLVVREHDCVPNDFAVVLDIVHALYALVLRGEVEDPAFLDTYWAVYRPRQVWIECIEAIRLDDQSGLRCVHDSPTSGPQRSFFAVFRKLSADELLRPDELPRPRERKRSDIARRLDQPLSHRGQRGQYSKRGR